jgi:hypothetical protein
MKFTPAIQACADLDWLLSFEESEYDKAGNKRGLASGAGGGIVNGIEYIHVTVLYACMHEMLRPVRSNDEATLSQVIDGTLADYHNCKHCTQSAIRAIERKMEKAGKL